MESNVTVLFSRGRSWRAFPARPPLLGVSFPQIVIFLTPWIFASWSLLHETYINYPTTNCDLEGHFPCMSYLLFWTYFSPQCLSLTNHLIYCLHLSIKMLSPGGQKFSCFTHCYNSILHNYPEKAMAPHSSTLAWKIPWTERSLVGCSPWSRKKLDATEQLHFHFSLSCIGEGNGNPLQCSCLENPKDGRVLWGGVYGIAQSRTQLK